jgi:hypothetical protein
MLLRNFMLKAFVQNWTRFRSDLYVNDCGMRWTEDGTNVIAESYNLTLKI